MTDFQANQDLDVFAGEARAWLAEHFPSSLKGKGALMLAEEGAPEGEMLLWRERMGAKGWGTPTWRAMPKRSCARC